MLFVALCMLRLCRLLYVGGQRMAVDRVRKELRVLNSSRRSDVEQTR